MTELIWEGKYDENGKLIAPLRLKLPFQTVETYLPPPELPPAPPPAPTPTQPAKPKAYTLRVPDTGTFMRELFDHETAHWGYKCRSVALNYKKFPPDCALPGTVVGYGCKPNDFMVLNAEWQWWWFEALVKAAGKHMTSDQVKVAWKLLISDGVALTDHHAPQNGFVDVVGGQNLGDPYGKGNIQIKCLGMAGNIVKTIGEAGGKVLVEALDLAKPPPPIDDAWEKPWLIQWATQSTMDTWWANWKLHYKNKHFPFIRWQAADGAWEKSGTPYPFAGIGGQNRIMPNRLEPIANGVSYLPVLEKRVIQW